MRGALRTLLAIALLEELTSDGPQLDHGDKEVGDTVELIGPHVVAYTRKVEDGKPPVDTTTLTDEAREEMIKMYEDKYVVVSNTEEHVFNCGHCSAEHEAQLIIGSKKTRKEYRIPYDMVTVAETKEEGN